MGKLRSAFFCQNCGYESGKWLGKCPSCGEWNSFSEEVIEKSTRESTSWKSGLDSKSKPVPIQEIISKDIPRLLSPDAELNRVLGGGIVPGSLVLIGGEPGIGKSTLLLQLALLLKKHKVLYVSGEESAHQIKMRAERIQIGGKTEECYVLAETSLPSILKQAEALKPHLVIVDSIQTLVSPHIDSAPGSVGQVRECTGALLRYAKQQNVPVFLVGHITKEGALAGPKVLEHMVDTVLQFEGDRHHVYRILRTIKNRFGASAELGIYEMINTGLKEVQNPSGILLSRRNEHLPGIAIGAMLEGLRPILIEVQALVGTAAYGTPQRSTTGFDNRRLHMLLAVLEKRFGYKLSMLDVFLNIAGGLKVEDPAIDLAVILSIISSQQELVISSQFAFAAEVGLSGEIRPVNRIEQRITEAEKLGFSEILISKYNLKGLEVDKFTINIQGVAKVEEAFEHLFG